MFCLTRPDGERYEFSVRFVTSPMGMMKPSPRPSVRGSITLKPSARS
jgi:hypothetical protein